MHNTGWRECRITSYENLSLIVYPHHALAFEDHVQFVLPFVQVRSMFLSGFERIQSGEQEIALRERAFPHFVG